MGGSVSTELPLSGASVDGSSGRQVDGVPGSGQAALDLNPGAASTPFCSGMGTAMYMQGFVSAFASDRAEQPCAVFLAPSLMMDTHGRFFVGCIGAAIIGILTEGASAARRHAERTSPLSWPLHTLWHGLTLSLGYADMLLVMVYNVELAASVVLGLCAGRLLFSVFLPCGGGGGVGREPRVVGDKRLIVPLTGHGGGPTPCCGPE